MHEIERWQLHSRVLITSLHDIPSSADSICHVARVACSLVEHKSVSEIGFINLAPGHRTHDGLRCVDVLTDSRADEKE